MNDEHDFGFWAFVIFALIGALVLAVIAIQDVRGQRNNLVKEICNYSRTVQDGAAEQRCGKAQDDTSTEYLCNLKSQCWVENK